MRTSTRLLAAAAVLSLAAPLAASASSAPALRAENVFFHCNGTTKVANVNATQTPGLLPTWNTTKPAASLTTGAGCGWADPGALRHTSYDANVGDAAFAGTFKGNLSSLTLKVHNIFGPTGRQTNKGLTMRVSLRIDGVEMFTPDSTSPGRGVVSVDPTMSSTNLSGEFAVTITGLPFATEEGVGTIERKVEVLVGTSEQVNAWVYDTTEVPSGIEFNPATPAKAVLAATPPPAEEPFEG